MRTRRASSIRKIVLGCAVAALALTGCASMMKYSGDEDVTFQEIPITSNPPGACVFIDGEPAGTTPVKARLARWKPHDVRIELAGYEPTRRRLKNSLNPVMLFNLLLIGGAPYGLAIDFITGAWDDYLYPGKIHLKLTPTEVHQPRGLAASQS